MPNSRKRLADGAFLLALIFYVLAGVALVPLHGDELMHMAMARDTFYVIHGQWDRLAFRPPIEPDTEAYLRLINGTINKTLIGVAWIIDGRDVNTLPGIFAWAMPLEWNRAQGNVPSDDAIRLARWPSALLTALGVIPVFILGWQLRLRSLAYPAALLYALHPVILLNGRRAMAEGSLILFTLLTIYWLIAIIIAEHSATANGFVRRLPVGIRYGILGALIGLTVATKYTGLVVAIAALSAALATGLMRSRSWRTFAWVGMAGVVGLLVWFALNPAYWNDPIGALRYTVSARAELLDRQGRGDPLVYKDGGERLKALVLEPFLTPPQYYEAPTWAGTIDDQISAYQRSSVDGWDWGVPIGILLTALAIIGLLTLMYDAWHRDLIAWAILAWTAATVVGSLAIPFAWQRYYLPLTLVAIILAAAGMGRLLVRRTADAATTIPTPTIQSTQLTPGDVPKI